MPFTVKTTGFNKIDRNETKKEVSNAVYDNLLKEAKTLFNRVNKRIRNLETNNKVVSPALQALEKKRGNAPRFGTKGTYSEGNLQSLKKEYAQALSFDNMETSTVAGARSYTTNLMRQIPNYNELSDSTINLIYDSLHRLHERLPDSIYGNLLKYTDYLDTIVETQSNTDLSEIEDYEGQVETIVTTAIENITSQVNALQNTLIDVLSGGFDRLY